MHSLMEEDSYSFWFNEHISAQPQAADKKVEFEYMSDCGRPHIQNKTLKYFESALFSP